jgi:serine/threonine protein kinase/tetratricopeptide (TPR) repeat protein
MTPEEWQRVRPILESALELDSAHRTAFLDGACVEQSLRREVESLIAVHEQAGTGFLSSPPVPGFVVDDEQHFRLPPGKRIGPYKILEEIALGGMGAVYRAIRADGQYKQQVALKIVRSELGTELTATRFKNERQILAALNHPNIARILDGGTTAEGMPYFVMELIEGQRLDEYCDAQKLATNERLGLFLQVCSAVQYAHQHLIIHRDIKPGNILVNAEGVPKLLDFGIAKILESSEVSNQPEQTISLVRLLTPEYASPEQVKGEPITTASDVYSLGVVLYELLTGRAPYNLPPRTPHEISRAVCESEPEKPSTAVRRKQLPTGDGEGKHAADLVLSAAREGSPEKLSKLLSGDLDNIVLMALRKDPQRRYASVDQFAQDIRRHLSHLPVVARKDTFGYRASKFIARHKAGVAVATLVTVALLAATGVTLRQARIAHVQQLRAERRFNDVRKLANSLMFEVHDSIRQLPGATAARKLIIERAQEYLDSLAQESKSDPTLLRELAAAYARLATVQGHPQDSNVGDTSKALQNARKAVELLEIGVSLEPSNRDVRRELAKYDIDLATILASAGDKNRGTQALQKAIQILEDLTTSNPEDPKSQAALAAAYAGMGFRSYQESNPDQALIYHEKALAISERLAKADPQNQQYQTDLSFAHKRVAPILAERNQLAAALEHERAALEIDERQLSMHPDNRAARFNITFTYSDTGWVLGKQGDFDGAVKYYRKALAIREALAEADPQDTRTRQGVARTYNYLGENLRKKGEYREALSSYEKALSIREALSQKDPADEQLRFGVAGTQSNIGGLFATMAFRAHASRSEVLQYCRESEKWNRKALPVWLQRKAQNKLGGESENLALLTQQLEKCDSVISRLRNPADASPR